MKVPVAEEFESTRSGPSTMVAAPTALNPTAVQAVHLGQKMSRSGEAFTAIATDMQRNINEAKVKERDNALAEQIRSLTTDPNGYLNTLGKDAIDNAKATREQLEKLGRDVGEGLDNEAQRKMITDVAQRRLNSALAQIGEHEAKQSKVYAVGQSAARAASAAQDMTANIDNPKLYELSRNTLLAEVRAGAALTGKSPEETAQIEKKALSSAHTDVINNLMAGNRGTEALGYLKEHGGEIDAEQRAVLKRQLESIETKDQSLRIYLGVQGKGYREQIAHANKLFEQGKIDADTHDSLMQRIDHGESQKNKRQDDNNRAMLGQVQEWVLQNPGASVQDMPDALYSWAKQNGQISQLNSMLNRERPTNTERYVELRSKVATEAGREEFSRLDLNTVRSEFSESDFQELVRLQVAVKENRVQEMEPTRTAARVVNLVKNDLAAARIDSTPTSTKEAQRWSAFNAAVYREVEAQTKVKGAPLTEEEALKIGKDLLKQGRLQGSGVFSDDRVARWEVTPEQQAETPFVGTDYESIPLSIRDEISASLAARRPDLSPDDDEFQDIVERTYQRAYDAGQVR